MSTSLTALDSQLARLSLQSPPTNLTDELVEIGFEIFQDVCSLGFFTWRPPKRYQKLSTVQFSDVEKGLDMNGCPKTLKIPSTIRMPANGVTPSYVNKYPYGQLECVHLRAATRRGVDWSTTDFCIGGSVLNMLADRYTKDPYFVCKVPHTNGTILISKHKEYTVDPSDVGHQFERLVTNSSDSPNDIEFTEHLQILKVGSSSVLISADADAISGKSGLPIEIKASNPRYWGTKVMLQMISSGSTEMCQGLKQRGAIVGIQTRSLSNVAKDAIESESHIRHIEDNVINGLADIQKGLTHCEDGEVHKVTFMGSKVKLDKVRTRAAFEFLPDSDVMKSLLLK